MIAGIENPLVFLGAGILLNLYPGPDTLYIIGRSLAQGRGAGVCAALGISSGALIHTLLGAFGLSAVLAASASAFTTVKYLGAAYLIYQGIRLILDRSVPAAPRSNGQIRSGLLRIYRQGVLTNLLNPKVAVFFLAFLPQFISVSSPNKVLSFILLGLIFITTGTIWCVIVALFSSAIASRLHDSGRNTGRLRQINGLLFMLLGLKLAVTEVDL
ncbi:MAG: LysE family translocator [Desulfofustis sp.]|nr:LysE family translocator [Desulfofustis sp.]